MPIEVVRHNSPLIVTLPYTGVNMPRTVASRLSDQTQFFTAPDRFLPRLLGAHSEGVNLLKANFHRFLSDVEYTLPRGYQGPQKGMIGPVPVMDRNGDSIWNHPPGMKEATTWRAMYYAPYHAALAAQLARIRALHGHAVLLNLRARHDPASTQQGGTKQIIGFADGGGSTCGIDLSLSIINLMKSDNAFAPKLNRDIRTGGTTRRNGRPNACIRAIDLELSETSYLTQSDADVFFDAHKAAPLRALLDDIIRTLSQWQP